MSVRKFSLDKSRIKVLLLEGVHENAVRYFMENGYSNIECHKEALAGTELDEKLQDIHILGIRSRTELRKLSLYKASRLFAIGCFSIGTNQVDIQDAKMLGIPVFNAPFSNTR
jgi:D-3-phosphoglycerate dehydrogenase